MSVRILGDVFRFSNSKGAARLVLLAMADEAHDSGLLTAYARSQSHLARKANVDERTVGRAIRDLVELGEVEVIERGDGRASSSYRITIEGRQDAAPPRTDDPPTLGETPTQGGRDAHPIIPVSPGPSRSEPKPRGEAILAGGFEEFWKAYPRHEAKGQARKAWPGAVQAAGGMRMIIDAAARYAADPNRVDQFTKHPATWLRAEGWLDGPLPPRTDGRAAPAHARIDEDRDAPGGRLYL